MRPIDADAFTKSVNGNPFVTDIIKNYIRVSVAKMPTVDGMNNSNDFIRKQDAIEAAKNLLKYHGEKGLTDEFINYVSTNAMERIDGYGQKRDILQRDEMS